MEAFNLTRSIAAAWKFEWRTLLHFDILVPLQRLPGTLLWIMPLKCMTEADYSIPRIGQSLEPHHLCAPADLLTSSVVRRDLVV